MLKVAPPSKEERDSILIAEDSSPNRKILGHLIEKLGFDVVACENGQEAWDKLNGTENPKRLIAIISDIMMPGMDGIQLLKQVRGSEKYKDIPYILVTAMSDKDYIVKSRELNVNGYILKPVTFQRVISKLQELFPNRKFPKLTA